jgi:hypothetical protein
MGSRDIRLQRQAQSRLLAIVQSLTIHLGVKHNLLVEDYLLSFYGKPIHIMPLLTKCILFSILPS